MMRMGIVFVIVFCLMMPLTAAAQILVGGGSIRFEPKGAAPVIFSHEKHVAANGRKCSGCHFGIFQMEKGSDKMNMSKITKGQFCGTCHNGRDAFDVENRAQCTRCHR